MKMIRSVLVGRVFITLILAICWPTFSGAVNLNFLRHSPASKLTAEDTALLSAAVQHALNHNEDNTTHRWHNPETEHCGELTPLNTYTAYGTTCRKLKIHNRTEIENGSLEFDFCQDPETGEWKILR